MSNRKNKKIIFAGVLIAAIILLQLSVPYKIENIPDEIYDMVEEGSAYENLLNGTKKIVWFGADCPLGHAKKRRIDRFLERNTLNENYTHTPFLVNSIYTRNHAEIYFIENCGQNDCITLPDQRKIIKITKDKKLFDILKKFKDR